MKTHVYVDADGHRFQLVFVGDTSTRSAFAWWTASDVDTGSRIVAYRIASDGKRLSYNIYGRIHSRLVVQQRRAADLRGKRYLSDVISLVKCDGGGHRTALHSRTYIWRVSGDLGRFKFRKTSAAMRWSMIRDV